jgi:hypothetical protein
MGLTCLLFGHKWSDGVCENCGAKTDAIIKKNEIFCCPFCGRDLRPVIDEEAKPVYEVFARMGSFGSSVTMDTARNQFIYEQGITCSCGKSLKPYKK